MATHSSILAGEFHGQRGLPGTVHGVSQSRTWLSASGPKVLEEGKESSVLLTIGIRTKGAGGGEGVLHAAHLLVHLLTEQVCAECQQSANHCLRGWTTNMPEMGLLGSGRENRPKTRSSQTSELVQGRVWGGSSALCLFIPKRQSHWPCLSHRWAGAWTEWRPPRDACTS